MNQLKQASRQFGFQQHVKKEMGHERHRSRETQSHGPAARGDDLQIESDEQKGAEKKSKKVEQKRISHHAGDDVKDKSYFAG